ncbi:MAG: alpha-hydroxy-acid oxidizing protein [Opitutus sp.]|nr:alpha-hydroxy-acid oxidizing protein [Opitutus sp.]
MPTPTSDSVNRRKFLQFLAASPLFAYAGAGGVALASRSRAWSAENLAPPGALLPSAADAFNVFDLEAVARTKIPVAHLAYLDTGVEGDVTVRANREGFAKIQLRPRRLVDTTRLDTSVKLFDTTWPTPIIIAPVASHCAFHDDGELAVARAARARNHLQCLSTWCTTSVEDVTSARGAPVWFQLYATTQWEITRALVQRAEAAGCPVVALTIDNPTNIGRETLERGKRRDPRDCTECHSPRAGGIFKRKSMFEGLDVSGLVGPLTPHLTWDFVKRLQDTTKMKVVLKGIVTAEDATLALQHQVAGIVVSNHGGRGEESGRSTIESLPEVVAAVGGKIPVLVDGGFRRGTDIFKALALGANAVCVGRPYIWGLGAYGQPGVERCLEILTVELEVAMRHMGTPTLASITRSSVQRA